MTGVEASPSCRLRIRAVERTLEVSVPADVPIADLLPAILDLAGPELPEQGVEHGGWALQRLGAEPLDEEGTPDSLDLRDGELLHLRPRRDSLPPVHFDDLVDGVADSARRRGDSWRPELTRRFALGAGMLCLAAALVVIALPGPAVPRQAGAVGAVVLLLIGAISAARALGDGVSAAALGAAAVPYAALAGALTPHGPAGTGLLGARLLSAGSAGAGAAVLALAAVGGAAPLFLAVTVIAVHGAFLGALAVAGLPPGHAAAICAVEAVILGAFIPSIAFRLSGLRLPPLPRNADELQEGIDPFPEAEVGARSDIADGYLTGLYWAMGAVCSGALTLVAREHGWSPASLAVALSLLLLLHSRTVGGIWQRSALVLSGGYGLAVAFARLSSWHDAHARLWLLPFLGAAAALLLITAWTVPGRRLLPYWGRAADILHSLTAASLLPLALVVAGVFHTLRFLGG